jgi:hypothetical protein
MPRAKKPPVDAHREPYAPPRKLSRLEKRLESRAERKKRLLQEQRQNIYLPSRLDLLHQSAKAGMDDEMICTTYGCSSELFSKWLKLYPSMRDALEAGRAECDHEVVAALHQRAKGYEYTETAPTKNGAVTVRRHMPADVGAAKYWLGNRRSGKWRERTQVDLNASVEVTDKKALIDDIIRMLGTPAALAIASSMPPPALPAPEAKDATTARPDSAGAPDPVEAELAAR